MKVFAVSIQKKINVIKEISKLSKYIAFNLSLKTDFSVDLKFLVNSYSKLSINRVQKKSLDVLTGSIHMKNNVIIDERCGLRTFAEFKMKELYEIEVIQPNVY